MSSICSARGPQQERLEGSNSLQPYVEIKLPVLRKPLLMAPMLGAASEDRAEGIDPWASRHIRL